MSEITHRTITTELAFVGEGAIVEGPPGSFQGGVVDPEVEGHVSFRVWPEEMDENGILNPPWDGVTVEGAFQLIVEGDREGYRELGRYLLAIAELDTTADPDFHTHHEMRSADGRTHLHLIVRRRAAQK